MEHVSKKNIVLVVLFILILIVIFLITGKVSYSYFERVMSDDIIKSGRVTTESVNGNTLIFSEGKTLSINATSDNFNSTTNSIVKTSMPIVRLVASNGNTSSTYNVGFRINKNTFSYSSGTNAEVLLAVEDLNSTNQDKYIKTSDTAGLNFVTVTDKDGNSYSGFDITNAPIEAVNVLSNYPISTDNIVTHKWKFTLVFVNLTGSQDVNENAEMEIEAIVQGDTITISE